LILFPGVVIIMSEAGAGRNQTDIAIP